MHLQHFLDKNKFLVYSSYKYNEKVPALNFNLFIHRFICRHCFIYFAPAQYLFVYYTLDKATINTLITIIMSRCIGSYLNTMELEMQSDAHYGQRIEKEEDADF